MVGTDGRASAACPRHLHPCDIARNIVDHKKLAKIRVEIENLQGSPRGHRPAKFVRLAKKLGRAKSNRGKEPTWVKTDPPPFDYPLSIPQHPKDVPVGTAGCIIDRLLDDVGVWESYLDQLESKEESDGKKDHHPTR